MQELNSHKALLEAQELLEIAEDRNVKAGEFIFKEGEEDNYFYVIIRGTIEIIKKTSDGNAKVITHLKTGDILGEGVLADRTLKPNSAKALTNTSLLAISRKNFDALVDNNARAGVNFLLHILGLVNERLIASNVRLLTIYEIDQLMALYRDDINKLSSALVKKLIVLMKSKDGVLFIKHPFENKYRIITSSDPSMKIEHFEAYDFTMPNQFENENGKYVIVNVSKIGALLLRRDVSENEYDEEEVRLLTLVADQTAKTIEMAFHRASDKARSLLEQRKFTT